MRYAVMQDFRTPTHRFVAGDEIDDSEIDGPLLASDWVDRGYLGPVADEDLAALRQEAGELGLTVDRRWGAARIREAIEAEKQARAEPQLAPEPAPEAP